MGLALCFALALPVGQRAHADGSTSAGSADGGAPGDSRRTTAPPKAAGPDSRAEVEISGTLQIAQRPSRLFAFVSRKACDPKRIEKDIIGSVRIDPFVGKNFFIEVFVPQGSTGSVCGAAMDEKGNIISFGAYRKNPLTFRGKGEVTFGDVVIPLETLPKPVPAPEQFKR